MKKFKTSKEGIKFFENFTYWKASQMSDYYYKKLEKAWELEWNYKKKNEIIWDMFWDWEEVISEIGCDLHALNWHSWLKTEKGKVEHLNWMLDLYRRYLQ